MAAEKGDRTMNLKRLGANVTEMDMGDGVFVLWSYETPVAYCRDGVYYRTTKWYSSTTSRHLNAWCPPMAECVDQSIIDKVVA